MIERLSPTQMFASAHSSKCEGSEFCYWCAAPCQRLWMHGEPPPMPFVRKPCKVKRPSSHFICMGCWLFRCKRKTLHYLRGGFKDGMAAVFQSWFITPHECKIITPEDFPALLEVLRKPPKQFTISLLSQQHVNYLHLCEANHNDEILADTELKISIDNVILNYSVYELEEALKNGFAGKGPGVQAIVRYLKLPEPKPVEDKRERGRPEPLADGRVTKQPIKSQQRLVRSGR